MVSTQKGLLRLKKGRLSPWGPCKNLCKMCFIMQSDTDFRTETLNVFCWGTSDKDNSSSCICMCTGRGFFMLWVFLWVQNNLCITPELDTPNSLDSVWKESGRDHMLTSLCFIWSLILGEAFILVPSWLEFGEAIRSNGCNISVCSLLVNIYWINQHPGRATLIEYFLCR